MADVKEQHNKKPIVQLLLEHGADVNAEDNHYSMPLHLATSLEPEIVQLLLQHGCHDSNRDAYPQGRPGVARPSDTSAKNIGRKERPESRRKHVDRSDGSGREY